MMEWGMWGHWMVIPVLMVVVVGIMARHWWPLAWSWRHHRRVQRGAEEREDVRERRDRDAIEDLESRVAELEAGLDFAERLLANRRELQELRRSSLG